MNGPGRPLKAAEIGTCEWCQIQTKEASMFVLPTQRGKKEFCSSKCLQDFRKSYSQGACAFCDSVLRGAPIRLEMATQSKEFCSTECLAKFQNKEQSKSTLHPSTSLLSNNPEKHVETILAKKNAVKYPSRPTGHSVEKINEFNWDSYLELYEAQPAPDYCFKQSLIPPENEFIPNMKLEAIDPRNTTSTCIASVVDSIGPRLRLRLDGSDASNDFWRLVDSEDISHIGQCEKNGDMLQPPLGFLKNASFWPTFLRNTLSGAIEAPMSCFKQPPPSPKGNYFRAGMKLEAVDLKNPHLICVATIGKINGEMIEVTFDGWNGSFDYETSFTSRDIFPVGWCAKTGHPLQSPGQKGNVRIPEERGVIVNINKTCRIGDHLSKKKVSVLNSTYGPYPATKMIQLIMQLLLECAIDTKAISQYVKQGKGKLVNVGRTRLNLRTVETPQDFWNEIQGFLTSIGCCEEFVADGECTRCTNTDRGFTEREQASRKRPTEDLFHENSAKISKTELHSHSTATSVSSVKNSTVTKSPTPTSSQRMQQHVQPLPPLAVAPYQRQVQSHPPSIPANIARTDQPQRNGQSRTDPTEWSTEDVISHIISVDSSLAVHADSFRRHEIDGKALLLLGALKTEMIMKYMDLKLGPALKISNIISKFEGSKRSFSNGI